MLTVYHSNRLENLFQSLIEILDGNTPPPLAPEIILVQSQGTARWLSLEIADHYGICANILCPFPASFIRRLFEKLDGGVGGRSVYQREFFVWAVMAQLDCLDESADFDLLRNYLAVDDEPVRRYQLARRLAGLFEQYMVLRPDWIRKWGENALATTSKDESWQARFWRQLEKSYGRDHGVGLLYDLLGRMDSELIRQMELPRRISLFGVPSLPVAQLAVFERLSEFIDVHMFLLNPCGSFWDEVVSKRQLARISLRTIDQLPETEDYFDSGCDLLASFGGVGRDFQRLLHSFDFHEQDFFEDPGRETLLAGLQSDILDDRQAGKGDNPVLSPPGDGSVRFHRAHSRRREVEILHDQLLDIFHLDNSVRPGDVLVMAPDISLYHPYIEAVFGVIDGAGSVPYSIADLGRGETSEVLRLFRELLELGLSRVSARQVREILDSGVFRRKFGLSNDDTDRIAEWLNHTSFCWGVDKQHRRRFSPGSSHGTLAECRQRLLLGYALPAGGRRLFGGLLPYDHIEGSDAEGVEGFLAIVSAVTWLTEGAVRERTLGDWKLFLLDLLDLFFPDDDDLQADKQYLRGCLDELEQAGRLTGLGPVGLQSVLAHLDKRMVGDVHGRGFLSGRVTFCGMETSRSVPFKVVCLLGMNDGEYPRLDNRVGFDLLGADHRLGDRLLRDEDRYYFLETLLSARKILFISFVGRSSRENHRLPPSIVVSELIEYIGEMFGLEAEAIERRLVAEHPLQPFSRRYFDDSGLFSYSATDWKTCRNLIREKSSYQGICGGGELETPGADTDTVTLEEFIRFFEHPVRAFVRERGGVILRDRVEELKERETFSVDALQRYALNSRLIESAMAGEPVGPLEPVFQAMDMVPQGKFGSYIFRRQAEDAGIFANRIRHWSASSADGREESIAVDINAAGIRLVGTLKINAGTQLFYRSTRGDRLNHRDSIRHWIAHLFLCATVNEERPLQSIFVCADCVFVYDRIPGPADYLEQLAGLYRAGTRAPLLLLPRASYTFARDMWGENRRSGDGDAVEKNLFKAELLWQQGAYQQSPENEDLYMRAAFGDANPVRDAAFMDIAETVLRPAVELRCRIDEA